MLDDVNNIVQIPTKLETGGTVRPADRTGVKLLKSPRTVNSC